MPTLQTYHSFFLWSIETKRNLNCLFMQMRKLRPREIKGQFSLVVNTYHNRAPPSSGGGRPERLRAAPVQEPNLHCLSVMCGKPTQTLKPTSMVFTALQSLSQLATTSPFLLIPAAGWFSSQGHTPQHQAAKLSTACRTSPST